MAALSTTIHLVLRKIGGKMPEDFMGCKCQEMVDLLSSRMREVVHQCDTVSCPCWMNLYPCTLKCKCRSCANGYVVRGSCSSTEPGQEGRGGAINVPDETTPPQVEEQSRGNWGFDLTLLPSSNPEHEQEGTSGVTNVPDKAAQTTPPSNSESEKADDTSSMTVEPPWMQYRGNRGFDLNQLPSSDTESEQEGTGGITNVPDKAVQTTPPSNSESEQADDTSSMTVEPLRMEDRGNRDFDLNQLPSSNTELAQADDTSSKDEEPAQGGEQDTESRDNRGLDQNKRRRSM